MQKLHNKAQFNTAGIFETVVYARQDFWRPNTFFCNFQAFENEMIVFNLNRLTLVEGCSSTSDLKFSFNLNYEYQGLEYKDGKIVA